MFTSTLLIVHVNHSLEIYKFKNFNINSIQISSNSVTSTGIMSMQQKYSSVKDFPLIPDGCTPFKVSTYSIDIRCTKMIAMTLLAMLNKETHLQFERSPRSDWFGNFAITQKSIAFFSFCNKRNINFHNACRVGVLICDKIQQFIYIRLEFAI